MNLLELDLKDDSCKMQKIVIKLNYSELSKICNQISKMEIKNDEDFMLKWQMSALHDLCHDKGIVTTFLPKHIYPRLLEQLENTEKRKTK